MLIEQMNSIKHDFVWQDKINKQSAIVGIRMPKQKLWDKGERTKEKKGRKDTKKKSATEERIGFYGYLARKSLLTHREWKQTKIWFMFSNIFMKYFIDFSSTLQCFFKNKGFSRFFSQVQNNNCISLSVAKQSLQQLHLKCLQIACLPQKLKCHGAPFLGS